MRFDVEHIDDRGQQITAGMADAWAVDAARTALEADPSEVSAELTLRRAHGLVFVTGVARAAAPRTCERCGDTMSLLIDTDVDLSYVPEGRESDSDLEQELRADELDVGWYADGHLDLTDTLREALSLALPPRVVCDDADACDARLRALLGSQPDKGGHPGFAALRNWTET